MHTVTVERFNLSVDTGDVLTAVMGNFDTDTGRVFSEIWGNHRYNLHAVPQGTDVQASWFAPRDDDAPESLSELTGHFPGSPRDRDNVFRNLCEGGYIAEPEPRNVVSEDSGQGYLSDDVHISAVTVVRPFTLVMVEYSEYDLYRNGGYARKWSVDTVEIPAGLYVIAERGQLSMSLHSIGYDDRTDIDLESLGLEILEDEDFTTCHMSAGCSANDGHRWEAECGSWNFDPSQDGEAREDLLEFAYDDADDHDENNTIACPVEGCAGRVGFSAI